MIPLAQQISTEAEAEAAKSFPTPIVKTKSVVRVQARAIKSMPQPVGSNPKPVLRKQAEQ